MKLTFLGSGAHGTRCNFHSNMLLERDGKALLIDCGSDIRHSLDGVGVSLSTIDGVYVSHLHSDHVGGLEWFAFNTYFDPKRWTDGVYRKPTLYAEEYTARDLWEHCLKGSLRTVSGQPTMHLNDYFEVRTHREFGEFRWNGTLFATVPMPHIDGSDQTEHSHGLLFVGSGMNQVFLTTDTRFCPNYAANWYAAADIIFHDCETTDYQSGVHAHFRELVSLRDEIKAKTWLYHTSDNNIFENDPRAAAFKGFVRCGQAFDL